MSETRFTNSTTAARLLGVPEAWLKREAREGRVPCLRAGRRLLFDVSAVEQALSERAYRMTDQNKEGSE
jgi:excisionase family DNA binding protein